jgi:two-component system sensor histidine kinase/response regulator
MDDYVSKPLHPHELVEAVERAVQRRRSEGDVVSNPASMPSEVVFDMTRARARLGGDRQLLREMIAIFRAEAPTLMASIEKAAAGTDFDALRLAAHALKGALGTLDAPRAFGAAARLEDAARRADRSRLATAVADLEHEMIALRRALASARRKKIGRRKVTKHVATPPRRRQRPRRR